MYLTAHRLLLPDTERISLPAAVSSRILALFLHHPVITTHTHRGFIATRACFAHLHLCAALLPCFVWLSLSPLI